MFSWENHLKVEFSARFDWGFFAILHISMPCLWSKHAYEKWVDFPWLCSITRWYIIWCIYVYDCIWIYIYIYIYYSIHMKYFINIRYKQRIKHPWVCVYIYNIYQYTMANLLGLVWWRNILTQPAFFCFFAYLRSLRLAERQALEVTTVKWTYVVSLCLTMIFWRTSSQHPWRCISLNVFHSNINVYIYYIYIYILRKHHLWMTLFHCLDSFREPRLQFH